MLEDVFFVLAFLFLEVINCILGYVVVFDAQISNVIKRYVIATIILLVIHMYMLFTDGIDGANAMCAFTLFVVPLLILKNNEKKMFFLYPIVSMMVSVFSVASSFVISAMIGIPERSLIDEKFWAIVIELIPTAILLAFYLYKKIYNADVSIYISVQQYLIFCIGILCSFVSMSMMQIFSVRELTENMKNLYGCATSIMCVVFIVMNLWQGCIVSREINYRRKNEEYEEYMKLQEERIREIVEKDEEMRRFRHDINAHITALKAYCDDGKNEELKKYFENIVESSGLNNEKEYTGNKAVDAIIRQLMIDAKYKSIEIEFKGNLLDDQNVSVYDLCTIISNLMKNAVEACEKIEDADNRKVELQIYPYKKHIYIRVENTVLWEVVINDNRLKTIKTDKRKHGLGSGNIERTVNKYGGEVKYDCKNNLFIAEVFI